jgi:hypothetical protein
MYYIAANSIFNLVKINKMKNKFKEIRVKCNETFDLLKTIQNSESYKESNIAYFFEKCKLTSEKLKNIFPKCLDFALKAGKTIKVVFLEPSMELSKTSQEELDAFSGKNKEPMEYSLFSEEMAYFAFSLSSNKYRLAQRFGNSGILQKYFKEKDYNVNPHKKGKYFLTLEIRDNNNEYIDCFECTLIGHGFDDIIADVTNV